MVLLNVACASCLLLGMYPLATLVHSVIENFEGLIPQSVTPEPVPVEGIEHFRRPSNEGENRMPATHALVSRSLAIHKVLAHDAQLVESFALTSDYAEILRISPVLHEEDLPCLYTETLWNCHFFLPVQTPLWGLWTR